MPDDFVEELRRRDAAEAARQRAIAGPQKPRRATKRASEGGSTGGYSETALRLECDNVSGASIGTRNDTLNVAGFNLGQLVAAGELQLDMVERELTSAALQAGLTRNELRQWKLPRRAIEDGMRSPRDMSDKGTQGNSDSRRSQSRSQTGHEKSTDQQGDVWDEEPHRVTLRRLSTVKSRVPQWVWTYDDVGRIQLGTLSMFAGKPAAGKSTAVRWFAARLSKGELEGCWHGHPMRVAVMMAEEQLDAIVVPGLQAAGAYMDNIVTPEFTAEGMEEAFQSITHERALTEQLIDNEIRALFVDPVMTAFSGNADVYRANEVRQYLEPFTRIAKAINGIVVCVAHLKKGQVNDVLGGMNGSSAFGEVPRAVFGFAPVDSGAHVMEQVKNSAGPNGLKLEYHLPVEYLLADDGLSLELPRFEIRGTTEIGISDIDASRDESTGIALACQWLHMYLEENPNTPSSIVKRDAKQHGDIGERMIVRASQRIGVIVRPVSLPGKPYTTVWCLPGQEDAMVRA
jgi:hypothetical protein